MTLPKGYKPNTKNQNNLPLSAEKITEGIKIKMENGKEINIKEEIGSGLQATVFAAEYDGRLYAVKWYYSKFATKKQRQILEHLVCKKPPSSNFVWPINILEIDEVKGFGFIMERVENRFKPLSLWINRLVNPSIRTLLTTCFNITRSFYLLHSNGLCYCDLSLNNILFDPSNGDIRIIDTDNIVINGQQGSVSGTDSFMAPEIVSKGVIPNVYTDRYSLSVIIFFIMFVNHPLEGKKESQVKNKRDEVELKKLYGSEALFIFDPDDRSNEPDTRHENALIYWKIYPKFLRDLFTSAFTKGIHDPMNGRITEGVWQRDLARAIDLLTCCGICKCENFYYPNKIQNKSRCWNCKRPVVATFWLIFADNNIVVLNHNTNLYPHHLDPNNREFDFSIPLAKVISDFRGSLFLENKDSSKWTTTTKDLKMENIGKGGRLNLSNVRKISFGRTSALVYSRH